MAILLFASSSGGCAIIIPTPVSVQSLEAIDTRPEGTIGPDTARRTKWRKFSTEIDRKTIRAIRMAETTFHVRITDCRGKYVTVEDLYVNGVALNRLSAMSATEFEAFNVSLDEKPKAFLYVEDADFMASMQLCAQFSGGGYTLVRIYNKQFRIK
jgi:hypothetical protein